VSTAVQLALIGVVVATILLILRLVRQRRLQGKYVLLWLSVCVLMLPLALAPDWVDDLMRDAGVEYPPAAYLLVASMLLFGVAVHQSIELSRLDERTRALAEEVALLQSDLDELKDADGPT
jgi:hypothetical protein